MNRTDLQQLAISRLAEAQVLAASGHPSGAYYLAGYALECAFKSRIASFTQVHEFPDKRKTIEAYTHSLRELVKAANLVSELQRKLATDSSFVVYWALVLNWGEESRYRFNSAFDAQQLIATIDDQDHGVLQWLKLYW